MKRVLVLGICGAGKSTLATRLGDVTGLEVIHLDQYFWNSGWVQRSTDDFNSKVEKLIERDHWIMDGNFSRNLHLRIPRADTVIYLDFGIWLGMCRVLKRVLNSYGKVRQDMAPGCPERFSWEFMKYVWRFRTHSRPKIERALGEYGSSTTIYRMRSPADVDHFLESISPV